MKSDTEEMNNFISSYNHLFGLFELTPEPILVANKQGKICYCNSIFYKIFGYEAADVVGNEVECLIPHRYRDKHPELMDRYWQHPKKRPMGTGLQPIGLKQNGEEVPLEISLSPVGEELVLCVLKDVTEQLRMKNKQQEYAQLNTVGLLTSSLIHEIANPVHIISGITDVLKMYLKNNPGDPYLVAKVDDIGFAVGKLIEFTNTFRVLIKNGDQKNAVEEGDVGQAIEIARRLCSHILGGVEFSVTMAHQQLPPVPLSTNKLSQILINLYANAAYAMRSSKDGQRKLSTVIKHSQDSIVVIEVSDSGPGVPKDIAEKIFDPMYSTKPVGQGTGLGLNICRDMLDKVGGKIKLATSEFGGACFEITVPCRAENSHASNTPVSETNELS